MKIEIVPTETNTPAVQVRLLPEILALGKAIGTFAGSDDLNLRVRNGYLVAADAGDQGGGQN
jgi:hypothetical protein